MNVTSSAGFSNGDFVLLSEMNSACNNGLFEVQSTGTGTITLRGVGTGTNAFQSFSARDLLTDTVVHGNVTHVNVCVFRCFNGNWFVADDDNANDMTFFGIVSEETRRIPRQEQINTQNITNTDTTLSDSLNFTPSTSASLTLFLNGSLQVQGAGNDYTVSGQSITWLAQSGTAQNLTTSDTLVAVYQS